MDIQINKPPAKCSPPENPDIFLLINCAGFWQKYAADQNGERGIEKRPRKCIGEVHRIKT
jgi:hypothetical protein